MTSIGILGGSFDPVHRAHVQVALTVLASLQLDEVRLMPCQQSPTRSAPQVDAEHRLAMLKLVVENHQLLAVDDRELQRDAPSYSVDSLEELRREHPNDSLFFIVGVDAFNGLLAWHQWKQIFELAHIVVVGRIGEKIVNEGELAKLLAERGRCDKPESLSGTVITGLNCDLPTSSTQVREALETAASVDRLLEKPVIEYIQENRLYQCN